MKSKVIIASAVTIWISICAFLTAQLVEFGTKPGEQALVMNNFPAASKLKLANGKFTIVAFLHPQCPCSKASVAELEELMEKCGQNANAYALFLKPVGCLEKFAKSDLFEQTSKIKNVQSIVDENGQEADIFGSRTSGQMMVYNPEGHLVFSGGITSARGHFGENRGLDAAIQSISEQKKPTPNTFNCTDVYGCPLFASNTVDFTGHRR